MDDGDRNIKFTPSPAAYSDEEIRRLEQDIRNTFDIRSLPSSAEELESDAASRYENHDLGILEPKTYREEESEEVRDNASDVRDTPSPVYYRQKRADEENKVDVEDFASPDHLPQQSGKYDNEPSSQAKSEVIPLFENGRRSEDNPSFETDREHDLTKAQSVRKGKDKLRIDTNVGKFASGIRDVPTLKATTPQSPQSEHSEEYYDESHQSSPLQHAVSPIHDQQSDEISPSPTYAHKIQDPVSPNDPGLSDDDIQTANTPSRVYLENVEPISAYGTAGFHPVQLHEIFCNRYEVVHKIGHGAFATIWLCLDHNTKEWRALKIAAAEESLESRTDIKINRLFTDQGITCTTWESHHIALPREHFWIEGPNGKHCCMVLPLLGPPIRCRIKANPTLVRKLMHQVADGVKFLHDQGIVHADLHPGNILLRLSSTTGLSKKEMLTILGQPKTEALRTAAGSHPGPSYPKYIVEPADLSLLGVVDEAMIIDFGESFSNINPPQYLGIPIQYAAPEARFAHSPGFSIDIWALCCTIIELRLKRTLFGLKEPSWVAQLEVLLGPLPEPQRSGFQALAKKAQSYYDPQFLADWNWDSSLDALGILTPLTPAAELLGRQARFKRFSELTGFEDPIHAFLALEQRYYDYPRHYNGDLDLSDGKWIIKYSLPRDEVLVLGDLLTKVFKYDPADRLTIDEFIAHPWFEVDEKKENLHPKPLEVKGKPQPPTHRHLDMRKPRFGLVRRGIEECSRFLFSEKGFLQQKSLGGIVSGVLCATLFWIFLLCGSFINLKTYDLLSIASHAEV
ncbi:kinase-like domain-containing protein [Xylariaceae sp. FL1019]|nr:kinase-like domain-containing protein [Xylariaceae sp. FL1019]